LCSHENLQSNIYLLILLYNVFEEMTYLKIFSPVALCIKKVVLFQTIIIIVWKRTTLLVILLSLYNCAPPPHPTHTQCSMHPYSFYGFNSFDGISTMSLWFCLHLVSWTSSIPGVDRKMKGINNYLQTRLSLSSKSLLCFILEWWYFFNSVVALTINKLWKFCYVQW